MEEITDVLWTMYEDEFKIWLVTEIEELETRAARLREILERMTDESKRDL